MPPKRDSATAKGKDSKPDPLAGLDGDAFIDAASNQKLVVTVSWADGEESREMVLQEKIFASGAFGWTASSRFDVSLRVPVLNDDGVPTGDEEERKIPVSLSCNLNIPGSKKANSGKSESASSSKSKAKSKKAATASDEEDAEDDEEQDGDDEEDEPPAKKRKTSGKAAVKGKGKKAAKPASKKAEADSWSE